MVGRQQAALGCVALVAGIPWAALCTVHNPMNSGAQQLQQHREQGHTGPLCFPSHRTKSEEEEQRGKAWKEELL